MYSRQINFIILYSFIICDIRDRYKFFKEKYSIYNCEIKIFGKYADICKSNKIFEDTRIYILKLRYFET